MQHILQMPTLFALSQIGSERYDLFRSYLSPNKLLQQLWKTQKETNAITWVLYSNNQPILYRLHDSSILNEVIVTDIQPGDTIFVPVSPLVLSFPLLLVLPKIETGEFSYKIDKHLHKRSSIYVWFEHYPYGKSDGIQQLMAMQKQVEVLQKEDVLQEQLVVQMIESNRRHAVTDLDTEQRALEEGVRYFKHHGYMVAKQFERTPLPPGSLLDLRFSRRHYLTFAKQQMKLDAEDMLDTLEVMYEEDLNIFMYDFNWVNELHDVFQYDGPYDSITSLKNSWFSKLENMMKNSLYEEFSQHLDSFYILSSLWSDEQFGQVTTKYLDNTIEKITKLVKKTKFTLSKEALRNEKSYELCVNEIQHLLMLNVQEKVKESFFLKVGNWMKEDCESLLREMGEA